MSVSSMLNIDLQDEGRARTLFAAILPEVQSTKPGVAKVLMTMEGGSIALKINASSLAALRALLNSYIRWFSTSLEIMELGD
ncbi:MAG: hypothetical protein H5T33_03765 [Candidatus Methanosuratus sp.]|nr:hypothetical protein [Candidatus Methanosuratincola sp.]